MNRNKTTERPETRIQGGGSGVVGPTELLMRKILNGSKIGVSHYEAVAAEFLWSYPENKHYEIRELAHRAHLLLHRLARRLEAGELLPVEFPTLEDINNAVSAYDCLCGLGAGPFREIVDFMHTHYSSLTAENLRFFGRVMHHWEEYVSQSLPTYWKEAAN